MKNRLPLTCLLLAVGLAQLPAQTTITTWTPLNTDFADPANWDDGVPFFNGTPGDVHGIIDDGNTAEVTTEVTGRTDWPTFVDTLLVGDSANSTLDVTSSGTLGIITLDIGKTVGQEGTVSVSGTLISFGTTVGVGGTGTLVIENGGTFVGGVTVAGDGGSTGTLLVTGTGSTIEGDPTLTLDGGIYTGNGDATITLEQGAALDGTVSIGGDGVVTFDVSTGATIDGGMFSFYATNSGTVVGTIDDAVVTTDGLLLNGTGTQSLTVRNGAQLDMSGATGVSEVGGGGSSLLITGSGSGWTHGSQVSVGNNSNGTVTISTDASAGIADRIEVGHNDGIGVLEVNLGASFTVGGLDVGRDNGDGSVTVDNATLVVTGNTDDFIVGLNGIGKLELKAGGLVTSGGNALIGAGTTGFGSAIVAGSGATWNHAGDVLVAGNDGSAGFVTLADGGTLNLGTNQLFLGSGAASTGILNIGADGGSAAAAPGTLSAAAVQGTSTGAAIVQFNHTDTGYEFTTPLLFGTGVVHKAGTTTLSGANSHTGGTQLLAGSLILGANNALGTGDVTLGGGTLDVGDFSQSSGVLTVTGNTFIDFSGSSGALSFGNSAAATWSGMLTLLNFAGSDTLRFGSDEFGLTAGQLGQINIGGFMATIDASGYISASATPVPEPSTYALLAGAAALGAAALRRRRAARLVT